MTPQRHRAATETQRPLERDPLVTARSLRQRFKSRMRTYGAWISIGHPEIASIFARAEGHFVGVDLEHTTTELSTVQAIIRSCHEFQRACLPRIFPGNLEEMRRLLDAGADGVIVPQVSSRAEIDRLVIALRYPPDGARSYGITAAHHYGRSFDEYVRSANTSLSLIVQVETVEAVERIEEMVSHPAVDGVMIGPYDLSGSMKMPGSLTHPRVMAACARVVKACAAHAVSCGTHLPYPTAEELRTRLAEGFTFLVLGSDVFNLWHRSVEVDAMIAACDDRGRG